MFYVDLSAETISARREAATIRVAILAGMATPAMRLRAATMAPWVTPPVSPRSWGRTLVRRLERIRDAEIPSPFPAMGRRAIAAWCVIAAHHHLVASGMRREAAILRRAAESMASYVEAIACPIDGRPSLATWGGYCLCEECVIDRGVYQWRIRMERARALRQHWRGVVVASRNTRRWLSGRLGAVADVSSGFRCVLDSIQFQCPECGEWYDADRSHTCEPVVTLASYPTRVRGLIGRGSLLGGVSDVYIGIEVETQSLPATVRGAREWDRVLRHIAAVAKEDSSIRGGEIVTPRIGRSAVWGVVRTIADMLHATGVELTEGAGVHIHVSRPTSYEAEARVTSRIYDVWRRVEDAAFSIVAGDHRRTCTYCAPIAHEGTPRAMDRHYAALSRSTAHPTYELRIGGWGGVVSTATPAAIYRYIANLVWLAWALRKAASRHSRAMSVGGVSPLDDLAALVPLPPDYSDVQPY